MLELSEKTITNKVARVNMKQKQQSNNMFIYGILGLIIVCIGALAYFRTRPAPTPPGAQELAQCLRDSGAKFYGAYWCPHCKDQKEMFGGAVKTLPYVECAIGNGQTKECIDAKIEGYPTWDNGKGERQSGTLSFKQLADFSGCAFTQ